MADKDSEDKQPWAVPVLVALVGTIGAIVVAWVNKPQQPLAQVTASPQATSSIQSSSSPPASSSPNEQKYNLTGVWRSEDHITGRATFYIRQVDSIVWGYSEGSGWSAVLKGTLSGDQISAEFADVPVPGQPNRHSGEVIIYIISSTRMHVVHPDIMEFNLSRQFD